MLTTRALRPRHRWRRLGSALITAAGLLGSGAVLTGCDDRLPGFANPPPYDGGSGFDAGDEDDAG